jgi:hypothetical protein
MRLLINLIAQNRLLLLGTHFLAVMLIAPTLAVAMAATTLDILSHELSTKTPLNILLGALVSYGYSVPTLLIAIVLLLLLNRHGASSLARTVIILGYSIVFGWACWKFSDGIKGNQLLAITGTASGAIVSILLCMIWTTAHNKLFGKNKVDQIFRLPSSIYFAMLFTASVGTVYTLLLYGRYIHRN